MADCRSLMSGSGEITDVDAKAANNLLEKVSEILRGASDSLGGF